MNAHEKRDLSYLGALALQAGRLQREAGLTHVCKEGVGHCCLEQQAMKIKRRMDAEDNLAISIRLVLDKEDKEDKEKV